jgi:hypothetical protein
MIGIAGNTASNEENDMQELHGFGKNSDRFCMIIKSTESYNSGSVSFGVGKG